MGEQIYHIGQPVKKKKSGWKAYIAYWYGDGWYQLSCRGFPTYSHTCKVHQDDIETREMPKWEVSIQRKFEKFANQRIAEAKESK